ncbi:MAG: phosphotransferase [Mycobacteriaceae bacterium]|nr:phosphotransferase [Mycobacteriaceae bacterium]
MKPLETGPAEIVARNLEHPPSGPVRLVGEGIDHVVYSVGEQLLVRQGKPHRARARDQTMREAVLLTLMRKISPLPVPRLAFVDTVRDSLGYHRLPGVPALEIPAPDREGWAVSLGHALGTLLNALHTTDPDTVSAVVDTDSTPIDAWLDEARRNYRAVCAVVPPGRQDAAEAFLSTAPPAPAPRLVFSHNDLGIEHVLVNPRDGGIVGIIDWTDAAITDPAADFGRLLRDLGPNALDRALASYSGASHDPVLMDRIWFFARCTALEDLAYGLEHHRLTYVSNSLGSLGHLFPITL